MAESHDPSKVDRLTTRRMDDDDFVSVRQPFAVRLGSNLNPMG